MLDVCARFVRQECRCGLLETIASPESPQAVAYGACSYPLLGVFNPIQASDDRPPPVRADDGSHGSCG